MNKIDKLWEIADRYNSSKPISGDWSTETEHQLNTTAKELGISKQEAKDLMIKELGFEEGDFENIKSSKQIKSDATDDFFPGKMQDKPYFAMSFYVRPFGASAIDDKVKKEAADELAEYMLQSESVDIVDWSLTSYGLNTYVIDNHPIAISQLISNIRSFEEQNNYKAWYFHFQTTDNPDAKPVNMWSNSISNSEWGDNDIETIDKIIQRKFVKSSHKPVKSSLMDEVMNFETTEDLDIYLRNKGYERRDGNGFFEYGIPNQPAELRVTEDNGGFIVDIKALTNSRFIVKRNRDGKYLGWSGTPENRSGNTIWVDDEKDATKFNSKEYIEKYKGELMGIDGIDNEFTVIESSRKLIKSATDYGWEVRSSDAMKALDMWVEAVGEEKALEDIAHAMGDDELRDNIEYIAEQWEFTDLIEDIDNIWGKYEEAKEIMGVTELLNSLTSAMGYDKLAECLVYIFRQHDFREWDEIESSRKSIKSARYIATDPESGEVLGSADTYEEAVNEWGENVTITDSKVIKSNADLSGEVYHWVVNAGALDELSEEERNDYMACAEHIASKIDDPEEFGYSDETPENANKFVRAIAYELQHNKDLIGSGCDKVEPVSPSRPVPKKLPPYKDNGEDKKKKKENKDGKSFADMLKEEQEKQKANSSKQSNHEFYTNIVSSLLSKDITEDQAVEQIASRNNVNKGYAKHILNSIVNDKQYIESGVMDIADDINKEVNLNDDLDTWAKDYIKDRGKSNTLAGEILRAYKQIEYRWFNDGDKIGIGYGKETVNPAARFLVEKCIGWTEVANIEEMLSGDSDINSDNDSYSEWVEDAKYSLEDYLRNNDDWFHTPNKQDMWESSTEDDKDTSVNECYITDDNSNQYWFYNRDGWVCTGVTYYNDQQFDVGDILDEDDVNNYISEPDDDFADFEDDSGFEYSAENNDGEWSITDVRIPEALAEEGDRWDISDFEDYDIYDPNGNEISIKDLY